MKSILGALTTVISIAISVPLVAHAAKKLTPQQHEEEIAKSLVGRRLMDPGSAQYRFPQMSSINNPRMICGCVNAKNAMGGYIGFSPFWVDFPSISPDGLAHVGTPGVGSEVVGDTCRAKGFKLDC